MIENNLKNAIVHFSNQDTIIQSTGRIITIYKHSTKLKSSSKVNTVLYVIEMLFKAIEGLLCIG